MKDLVRSLTVAVALAASMSAMATESAVEAAAAPAATPAAASVPATEAPKPAAEAKNEPVKVPAGYKVKVVNGETRFCRKETPLGSRFATEVCMTQAQYLEQERNRDSMRNSIQDRQKSYSINY